MKDKTTIIEKIACCPERLTDAEIKFITQDAELKELYESASVVSQSLTDAPDFNVEESLMELHADMLHAKQKTHSKGFFTNIIGSKAAVLGAVSLTALAAIATIYFSTQSDNNATSSVTESVVSNQDNETSEFSTKHEKLYYDDALLSQILSDLCQRYHCAVRYKNSASQNSRFHLTIPAEASLNEAVDLLNAFDEVRISLQGDSLIVE